MLTVIGTPYYMAPEIFLGGGYDERSDLWSLGVTVYKMVTGKTPFESEYRAESIKKI
jgi:serine/threonine protein kinase